VFQLTAVPPDTNTFQLCVDKSSTEASPVGKELLVLGQAYASLSWFLCSSNPTTRQVSMAKTQCVENALELQGPAQPKGEWQFIALESKSKPKEFKGGNQPQYESSGSILGKYTGARLLPVYFPGGASSNSNFLLLFFPSDGIAALANLPLAGCGGDAAAVFGPWL